MTDKQIKEEMEAIKEIMLELVVLTVVGAVFIEIAYTVFNWL